MPVGNLEKYKTVCVSCSKEFYGREDICCSCLKKYEKQHKGNVLMRTWEYKNTASYDREVPLSLAYALGEKGSAYKIQAISLDFGIVLYEWRLDV